MTELNPDNFEPETPDNAVEVPNDPQKDDPARPWKAIAGALAAGCAAIITANIDSLPAWVTVLCVFGAAAGGTYAVKNPKVPA